MFLIFAVEAKDMFGEDYQRGARQTRKQTDKLDTQIMRQDSPADTDTSTNTPMDTNRQTEDWLTDQGPARRHRWQTETRLTKKQRNIPTDREEKTTKEASTPPLKQNTEPRKPEDEQTDEQQIINEKANREEKTEIAKNINM